MKVASILLGENFAKFMNKIFRPRFWKFYYWLLLLGVITPPLLLLQHGYGHITAYIIDSIYCLVNAVALYVFIHKRKFLSGFYWKILFWFDAIYLIIGVVYQFAPNTFISNYLSVLVDDGTSSNWINFVLNILLAAPLLYAVYLISEGLFLNTNKSSVKKKNNNAEKIIFQQWGRFIASILLVESIILFTYALLVASNLLTQEQLIIPTFGGFGLAVALPFVIYIFKVHKRTVSINIFSLKLALIILLGILLGFHFVPKQTVQPVQVSATIEPFSSDDLMEAVNKQRIANKVSPLQTDESTCLLAKVRADQFSQNGAAIYGDKASLDRAYEIAFGSFKGTTLDWYYDYLTYEANIADTVKKWNSTSDKSIFKNENFQYGCAAVENGYGVVVTGYNEPSPTPEQPLPSGVKPAGSYY